VDDTAIWYSSGRDCAGAFVFFNLVEQTLSEGGLRVGSDHSGVLFVRASGLRASTACGQGIHELYRVNRLPLCGVRWNSHQRQRGGDARREHSLSVCWRCHREYSRNNGCLDVADSAVAADEQISCNGTSCGFLYFHRFERRRLLDAHWGSAAVHGLFERHPVLVGGEALLADLVGRDRNFTGAVLYHRLPQLSARSQTRPRENGGAPSTASQICSF
jgi:hypothetical protein